MARFEAALQSGDAEAAAGMFLADGWWRDILALTWDLRTFPGQDLIAAALREWWPARRLAGFWLEDTAPEMFERRTQGWTIEAFFTFETDVARCRGHVRLFTAPGSGEWKAWTLLTAMEDLKGFEEKAGALRPAFTVSDGLTPRPPARHAAGEPVSSQPVPNGASAGTRSAPARRRTRTCSSSGLGRRA